MKVPKTLFAYYYTKLKDIYLGVGVSHKIKQIQLYAYGLFPK